MSFVCMLGKHEAQVLTVLLQEDLSTRPVIFYIVVYFYATVLVLPAVSASFYDAHHYIKVKHGQHELIDQLTISVSDC